VIAQTVGKYWISWLAIVFVLEYIELNLREHIRLYVKFIMLSPVLLFAIPIACYYVPFLHSAPFSLFLFGRLFQLLFGVKAEDMNNILRQSYFQRRFGPIVWLVSYALSIIGIAWGAYNLFIK